MLAGGWRPASDAKALFGRSSRARFGVGSSGRSCRETAALFGVSVASVVRWSQRQRAIGSAGAHRMGRSSGRAPDEHRNWLLERASSGSAVSLRSLVADLAERGVTTSAVSIWRVLRSAASASKKSCSPASRTGRQSRGGEHSGSSIRAGSSSSMRPGPRPT